VARHGNPGLPALSPEFDLIERIRARAGARADVLLGIGDDAALLQVPEGQHLAWSTDTLVSGVHFPEETAPADIGWKSLAVNLSDLAAMGASPAWVTLALTMPEPDVDWLDFFLDGFCELAEAEGVVIVGGDTTRGPLSITIGVQGFVPAGLALRRDGAGFNDDIWVTGTLGDAAGALRQWKGQGLQSLKLRYRLDRPTPQLAAGIALRELASAAIDISDGVLADLGHILERSGVGAELDLGRLPTSRTLAEHFPDEADRWRLQLAGGDDYELCFTASPANALAIEQALAACGVQATVVGRITREPGLRLHTPEGEPFDVGETEGFDHFRGKP
jgi:thiamine-monophosphate kinase